MKLPKAGWWFLVPLSWLWQYIVYVPTYWIWNGVMVLFNLNSDPVGRWVIQRPTYRPWFIERLR